MADAALRWIEMLRRIPRLPRKIDTMTLHQALIEAGYKLDARSLQRDLNNASRIFPIQRDRKTKPYRWYYPKDYLFNLPALSPPMALAFSLLKQHGERLLPAGVKHQLLPWFKNAEEILNRQAGNFQNWRNLVRVVSDGMALMPPTVDEQLQNQIQEALMSRRRFKAMYKGRKDPEPKEQLVNPLGLVASHQVLYLVATLWNYEQPVQLALHRFHEVELLDEPAIIPDRFDLDEYIASGAFGLLRSQETLELKLRISKARGIHLLETPLSADQVVLEEDEENLLLQATVPDTARLEWWILSFGGQAEVLAPESLRMKIAATAEAMAARYDAGD